MVIERPISFFLLLSYCLSVHVWIRIHRSVSGWIPNGIKRNTEVHLWYRYDKTKQAYHATITNPTWIKLIPKLSPPSVEVSSCPSAEIIMPMIAALASNVHRDTGRGYVSFTASSQSVSWCSVTDVTSYSESQQTIRTCVWEKKQVVSETIFPFTPKKEKCSPVWQLHFLYFLVVSKVRK